MEMMARRGGQNSALEYKMIADDTKRFTSMAASKIDGFRLNIGMPLTNKFGLAAEWELSPKGAQDPMAMMQGGGASNNKFSLTTTYSMMNFEKPQNSTNF